jgi:hypothetical protein
MQNESDKGQWVYYPSFGELKAAFNELDSRGIKQYKVAQGSELPTSRISLMKREANHYPEQRIMRSEPQSKAYAALRALLWED